VSAILPEYAYTWARVLKAAAAFPILLAGRLLLDLADAVLVELDGVTFRGLVRCRGSEGSSGLRTHERKDLESSRARDPLE
jgi:hypothetical protein